MKRKSFIIAALVIGMITCFASCKKKTVEPTPDPTPEPIEYVCTHDTTLIHVLAVEPTEEENGCNEHYECSLCHAAFADAQGTIPVDNPILWATNYVIDNENIYENTFADFAGDVNYMYRACIGMPGSVANESALWGDYSDWQNWNEAQWQAYWRNIDVYYSELGGEGDLMSGDNALSLCISSYFISRVITKNIGKIDHCISAFFEDDQGEQIQVVNEKLDKVLASINNIQSALTSIATKLKDNDYISVVDRRYNAQIPLHNATATPFNAILQKIQAEYKANNKVIPFSQLSVETRNYIANITREWYNKPMDPENKLMNMLDFVGESVLTGKTLPETYDYLAVRSNAWEHEAQNVMEMARASDAALMCECYLMDVMYYNTNPGASQIIYLDSLNKKMLRYAEILKKHQVERHEYLCCLIPGSGVYGTKFAKDLIHLKKTTDYINNNFSKPIRLDQNDHVDEMVNWVNPEGFVDWKWYETMVKYYQDKTDKQQLVYIYPHDILRKAGFKVPETVNCYIVGGSYNGYKAEGNRKFTNRIYYYSSHYSGTDDMCINYGIHQNYLNTAYVRPFAYHIIKDMIIKVGTHRIADKGTSIGIDGYFYTLKRYNK